MEAMSDAEQRIAELQRRIAELRARLPKHSPPASMMVELDELEDKLQRLEGGDKAEDQAPEAGGQSS